MAQKKNRPGTRTGTTASRGREQGREQIEQSTGAVRAASSRLRERDAAWRASLDEVEQGLLEDDKVPEWTIKFHARMGHLGGAALFVLGSLVFWPVLAVVCWQLLMVFGSRIVTEVPSIVLGELNVNATTVATRTDSFVFSWVMPVLFFVLVLAGVTLWGLRGLVGVSVRYSRRLARGLFTGYGTGLRTDFTAVRLARGQRRAARADKAARMEKTRAAVDAEE